LDIRESASKDPRRFLSSLADGAILDEVQRVPSLSVSRGRTCGPGLYTVDPEQWTMVKSDVSRGRDSRMIRYFFNLTFKFIGLK
jgi:hypothetical protein